MRDRIRVDEMLLKARLDGGFHLVNPVHRFLDGRARRLVAQRNPRARAGGVPGRGNMVKGGIRDHPQHHRMFRADMRAKGPSQNHTVNGVDPHFIHQQTRPGIKRRFRKLNGADIGLGDHDHRPAPGAAIMQKIGMRAAFQNGARGAGLFGAADQPLGIDQPGHAHFRNCLDDAGPADAGDAGLADSLVKARLVRPQV